MRPLSLLLVVTMLVSAVACEQARIPTGSSASASAVPSASPRAGGILRVGLAADPASLDPSFGDENAALITRQVFETLVDLAPGSFTIVPKLALSWELSPDAKTWTFRLRDDVKFHDGTEFTAQAVVQSLQRAPRASVVKVEAKDLRTVAISTQTPYGPLLASLASPTSAIVSPQSIQSGTGPFRLTNWAKGQSLTLARNTGYWDRTGPALDGVTFRFISDTPARIAELKAGTVDVIRDFSPGDITVLKADPNLQVISRPSFNVAYLGLNVQTPPLDNVSVRRAIAMAINKQAAVSSIYGGEAKIAAQFVPPGMLGFDDTVVEFAKYDEARAKQLLIAAGFVSGFEIDLWYSSLSRTIYPDAKRVAQSFASDFARVGIRTTVKTGEVAAYSADLRQNKLSLWLGASNGQSADPDGFLGALFNPAAVGGPEIAGEGGWLNPQVADLLRKGQSETDSSKRAELYKQTSKIVQNDVPRIPLFYVSPALAASKKVKGLTPQATGVDSFMGVSFAN